MKRLYALLTMTALFGWMPGALCVLLIKFALNHGAGEWSELTFDVVFLGFYAAFVGAGAYVYSRLNLSW